MAAGEAIDEGRVLVKEFQKLLNMEVQLIVDLDSKDLFDTLCKCRSSIHRSIRANLSVIRYELETENANRIIWISGKTNLLDPLIKPDSSFWYPFQLTTFSGEI